MASPKNKKKLKGFKEFDPTKYIDTEPTLDEAVMKDAVVISFGRMNPITVGHEKLVSKVSSEASRRKADGMVFMSHSQDAKKNPLSYDDKVKFAKKAFGNVVQKSNSKTIIDIAKSLTGKYKNLVMVVGSDRVDEFEKLLNKYNGKDFNFESIQVVSAGARDPDAEGVEGMSASKMRSLAAEGNVKEFAKGLPKRLQSSAANIMAAVRKGMNMTEENEDLSEALSRMQRRKRALAMKKARFKIKRGKEKAEKRTASQEVLKKRARKAALNIFKQKFAKNRRYAELSAGEKEVIDKRIEKISKKRIEAIARKLLPKVKQKERDRRAAKMSGGSSKNESINEASLVDTTIRKRPHQLMDANNKPKFDGRFRMFKKKNVNESVEDLTEELAEFALDMDNFVEDYYKGVPKDKKDDREAHFKRNAEKPGDGPDKDSNYKPAPGDFKDGKRVKTKLSKHTKKYHAMYGEELELDEDATASLKKKAEKTGMPLSVLRKVYNRGVAAWKSGHRPGTTPEQWGHARVNSFVTKSSGTWGKADKDLAAQVRKESVELDEATFKVDIDGLPSMFVDAESAPQVKKTLRQMLKKPDDKIKGIERVQPAEVKKHFRLKALGKDEEQIDEVLKPSTDMGTWIKDFQDSDAPQFKGKSDEKKRKMAIAAKLAAERNEDTELDELSMSLKDVSKSGLKNATKGSDKLKADLKAMRDRLNKTKNEEAGAGEEGTDKLVKKLKKDTPSE